MTNLKIRALARALFCATILSTGGAQAANLAFYDSDPATLTFGASQFEGGYHFTPAGPTVADGTAVSFSGTWITITPRTGSGTYLIASSADPTRILAEMDYTLTPFSFNETTLNATFWGDGSGHSWSTTGTTLLTDASGVAFTGFPYLAVYFTPEIPGSVPEPASWAMMLSGFGLIGGAMRRKRRVALAHG